ncbi:MAG: FAD-binding oxidoreductase [Mycobacteriales bacterium]
MRTPRDFDGLVIEPGDPGYDAARAVWNGMVDRRPAAIARCASTPAVVAALRYGRAAGLEIGVRGGGHSVLGLPVADGGLVIDLSLMGAVRVDPDRRRAWVQGGALLGALDRAAQPYGLATTAGNVSHTGVGGLTLGGGVGWLARRCGLSCDNVVSFEVVTADGEVLRASEREHPELYWGLRGGGGNFGVVTGFEFRLHPVGTRALVAEWYFAPEEAAAALAGWRDLAVDAPRPATFVARTGVPDGVPGLPARWRGRPLASAGYVWVGDPEEGRRLAPALRGLGPAVAERVVELSYLELQTGDDDREGHARRRYWKGHYLDTLPDAAIRAFLDRGAGPGTDPATLPSGRLTTNAGAIADVGPGETAFTHRDAAFEFSTGVGWSDPAEDAARMAVARRYAGSLEPYASGVYVNLMSDDGPDGIGRAYGAGVLTRLTALKDQLDPDNVFHLTQNVRPSGMIGDPTPRVRALNT